MLPQDTIRQSPWCRQQEGRASDFLLSEWEYLASRPYDNNTIPHLAALVKSQAAVLRCTKFYRQIYNNVMLLFKIYTDIVMHSLSTIYIIFGQLVYNLQAK